MTKSPVKNDWLYFHRKTGNGSDYNHMTKENKNNQNKDTLPRQASLNMTKSLIKE